MKSMTASHDTDPSGSPVGPSSVIVSASLSSPKTLPRCRDEILMGSFIMVPPPGGKRTGPPFPYAFSIHHASGPGSQPRVPQNESLTLRVFGDALGYVKFSKKSTVRPESVQQRFDAEKTMSGTVS